MVRFLTHLALRQPGHLDALKREIMSLGSLGHLSSPETTQEENVARFELNLCMTQALKAAGMVLVLELDIRVENLL